MTKPIQRRTPLFAKRTLLEASLSRIYDHYRNREFGLVSASRKERTKQENELNYTKLKSDIGRSGFSYVVLRGFGQEIDKETGKNFVVEEATFLVIDHNTASTDFKQDIIDLGKAYDQDYIIFHTPAGRGNSSSVTELIESDTGATVETFPNIHFNNLAKVYSKFRNSDRTFNFEKVLADAMCKSSFSQLGRTKQGELLELTGSEEDQLLSILKYLKN